MSVLVLRQGIIGGSKLAMVERWRRELRERVKRGVGEEEEGGGRSNTDRPLKLINPYDA